MAADGIFVLVGGTIDTDRGPAWVLLPVIGAATGTLAATPWALGAAPSQVAVRALGAAVLGAALSVAWAIAVVFVLLIIACHGHDQCLG